MADTLDSPAVPAPPDPGSPASAASLLGSYSSERFFPHATWSAVLRTLEPRRGGTYALSGPRGAGKSWVMEHARKWAERQGGLLVVFPSPSVYEPVAFVASISDVVATRFQSYYDVETRATTRAAQVRFKRLRFVAVALAYLGIGVGVYGGVFGRDSGVATRIKNSITPYELVAWLAGLAAMLLFLYARSEYRKDSNGLRLVRRRAEELRQQVRYAVTLKESSELGLEGKSTSLAAHLKRASERQLVERPATLSSFIQGFRDFVELMAREVPGPIIIAVDELDKMSDPEKVAQLLRDIKGIFDVEKVTFLVSLSSEAARNLDLGGVRTRNEFNSSFYSVFDFPPLTPAECVELLRLRRPEFPAALGTLAGILGTGVPREVVRIAELVCADTAGDRDIGGAITEVFRVETRAFLEEALAADQAVAPDDRLGTAEKLALHEALDRLALASPSPAGLTEAIGSWTLNDESPAWCAGYQEEWRRLLVRLAVGGLVLRRPAVLETTRSAEQLQHVLATASLSAAVGLIELGAFASEAVFARSNGHGVNRAEASLAAYLLAREGAVFRRSEFLRFAESFDADVARGALAAFCDDGILRYRVAGGLDGWWAGDRIYRVRAAVA